MTGYHAADFLELIDILGRQLNGVLLAGAVVQTEELQLFLIIERLDGNHIHFLVEGCVAARDQHMQFHICEFLKDALILLRQSSPHDIHIIDDQECVLMKRFQCLHANLEPFITGLVFLLIFLQALKGNILDCRFQILVKINHLYLFIGLITLAAVCIVQGRL